MEHTVRTGSTHRLKGILLTCDAVRELAEIPTSARKPTPRTRSGAIATSSYAAAKPS